MMFKALVVIVAGALLAQAQSDTTTAPPSQTSPAGLDDCILSCVTPAATDAGCSSFADLSCVCTSTTFQQAALNCLQANCTQDDVQAVMQLQKTECAALTTGTSSTPTATDTSTDTSTSAASTDVSTPATTDVSTGVSTTTPTGTSTSTSTTHSTTTTHATTVTSTVTSTPSSTSKSGAMALSVPVSFGALVGTLVTAAAALVGAAFVL